MYFLQIIINMRKTYKILLGAIAILLTSIFVATSCDKSKNELLTSFVDPLIGSGDHGHVFVGANVPYGFVQVGPTEFSQGWDWCSGYHYSDSLIIGFSQMHLSGTGIGDLGDIMLMPVVGEVKMTRGELGDNASGIYSKFSHENEIAKPGFYSVLLDRFGILAEMTATNHVGFQKYTFPKKTKEAGIIIDLEHGIGWDTAYDCYMKKESDTRVIGYRKSKGWAKNQEVYFVAEFSKRMSNFFLFDGPEKKDVGANEISSNKPYFQAVFETQEDNEPIYVKVALSAVSVENAKQNMQTELDDWDFLKTKKEADKLWNDELAKIKVKMPEKKDLKIFYTALYHTMMFPSVFQDVNGDYRGADGKVYNDTTFVNLTVLSLWDTYRAAFPLMSIINSERSKDVAKTMLNIYKQQGKLPVWHLVGNETDCMVGNPGVAIMGDYFLKGLVDDKDEAYEAMKISSMLDDRGMSQLKEYGYIPYDKDETYETVAKGLEFALADWCVAQVAQKQGDKQAYDYFINRSKSYKKYFDPESKFVRGRSSDGSFREPFNPISAVHMKDDFTEGNSWQYTWLVPHDVSGLVQLMGGENYFINKLDSLFIVEGNAGEHSNDITGLIGQYAHGNEPSHHIAYLYPYVGQPWKTAEKVREILEKFYFDSPAGVCGNEDVGQISAWYVMSALGFYQVEPAGGKFVFGSP